MSLYDEENDQAELDELKDDLKSSKNVYDKGKNLYKNGKDIANAIRHKGEEGLVNKVRDNVGKGVEQTASKTGEINKTTIDDIGGIFDE